jgi:hypothetical protein
MIAVFPPQKGQQTQQHENRDNVDDCSPLSLSSSSSTAATTTYRFLRQTCRRPLVLGFLAALVVSLWNVGTTSSYLSQYSTSSTDGYRTVNVPWSAHNSSTFMSSCLLWMDDNHYLVEWLAYHYTVLPLRRLIICIDPNSQTSPLTILERYSRRGLMNITIWYETDLYSEEIRNQYVSDSVGLFLRRQNHFYLQCMKTLKEDYTIPQKNRSSTTITSPPPTQQPPHATNTSTTTNGLVAPNQPEEEEEEDQQQTPIWVTMFDIDEFIVLNHLSPQPSIGLNETKPTVLELLTSPKNAIAPYPNPCVPLSRSSISILEGQSDVQAFVPPSLEPYNVSGMNFKTLRYPCIISDFVLPGKALLDLRNADSDRDFRIENVNCHRPLMNHCTQDNIWITPDGAALGVYHYPGTLEQFTFRNADSRNWTRIPEKYALLNTTRAEVTESPNARLWWLQAFIEQVGIDLALALLRGAGEVNPQ